MHTKHIFPGIWAELGGQTNAGVGQITVIVLRACNNRGNVSESRRSQEKSTDKSKMKLTRKPFGSAAVSATANATRKAKAKFLIVIIGPNFSIRLHWCKFRANKNCEHL
jgi:hypothetical protein